MTADDRNFALQMAMQFAFAVNPPAGTTGDVLAVADAFYRWLEGPVSLVLTAGLTYQQAVPGDPGVPTLRKGNAMQLSDTQQVTLSVAETDSKGQPVTGDALTWSVDNPAVIALTPAAGNYSCLCVAGTDGTATVTVTDGSATPPLTATDVLTVVSSAATALVISEGTAEAQPPKAP